MISNEQLAQDTIASMRTHAHDARDLMGNGSVRKRLTGPHVLSGRIPPTTIVTLLLHILGKERIEHGLGVDWKKLSFIVCTDFYT